MCMIMNAHIYKYTSKHKYVHMYAMYLGVTNAKPRLLLAACLQLKLNLI